MYNFVCAVLVTQIAWRIIDRYIIIIILKPACTWSQYSGVYAYIVLGPGAEFLRFSTNRGD